MACPLRVAFVATSLLIALLSAFFAYWTNKNSLEEESYYSEDENSSDNVNSRNGNEVDALERKYCKELVDGGKTEGMKTNVQELNSSSSSSSSLSAAAAAAACQCPMMKFASLKSIDWSKISLPKFHPVIGMKIHTA